jgi:hypothetical protein
MAVILNNVVLSLSNVMLSLSKHDLFTSFSSLIIVPCDAPLYCISLLSKILASPPSLLSKREEAVLQIFTDLHNYHIN